MIILVTKPPAAYTRQPLAFLGYLLLLQKYKIIPTKGMKKDNILRPILWSSLLSELSEGEQEDDNIPRILSVTSIFSGGNGRIIAELSFCGKYSVTLYTLKMRI